MCLQLWDRATLSRSKTQPRECSSVRQIILNTPVPLIEDLEREQKRAWNKRTSYPAGFLLKGSHLKLQAFMSPPSTTKNDPAQNINKCWNQETLDWEAYFLSTHFYLTQKYCSLHLWSHVIQTEAPGWKYNPHFQMRNLKLREIE